MQDKVLLAAPVHLALRFFGFLTAQPLTPREQQEVSGALAPDLARAFFAQRFEDQRHGFEVCRRVEGRHDLREAALLHDIGKTESDLGAFARSAATLWNGLGFAVRGRWRAYLDHGESGARMLEELGAGSLAVAFTRYHPGAPPPGIGSPGIDPESWRLLKDADS